MSEHRLGEAVIERPRGGARYSSRKCKGMKKRLGRLTEEASEDGFLSPYLIKVEKQKWFSDCLGPLRRFLRSHVGQPWDVVYSKLAKELDFTTLSGQHILSHVWGFVELNVEMIDGVPYHKFRRYWMQNTPVPLGYWRGEFYIDPQSGLLCYAQAAPKAPTPPPSDRLFLSRDRQYRKIDGIWYLITLADEPAPVASPSDEHLRMTVDARAIGKRQCNKKEVRWIEQKLNLSLV